MTERRKLKMPLDSFRWKEEEEGSQPFVILQCGSQYFDKVLMTKPVFYNFLVPLCRVKIEATRFGALLLKCQAVPPLFDVYSFPCEMTCTRWQNMWNWTCLCQVQINICFCSYIVSIKCSCWSQSFAHLPSTSRLPHWYCSAVDILLTWSKYRSEEQWLVEWAKPTSTIEVTSQRRRRNRLRPIRE